MAHLILLNGTTANIIPIYMDILQDDNKNIPFSLQIASILLFLRSELVFQRLYQHNARIFLV